MWTFYHLELIWDETINVFNTYICIILMKVHIIGITVWDGEIRETFAQSRGWLDHPQQKCWPSGAQPQPFCSSMDIFWEGLPWNISQLRFHSLHFCLVPQGIIHHLTVKKTINLVNIHRMEIQMERVTCILKSKIRDFLGLVTKRLRCQLKCTHFEKSRYSTK